MAYMDKAALVKAIDSIAKRGATLDKDIQEAGLSALHHLEAHGDIGFVNRLFLALGKGHRKSALTAWYLAFGKMVANTGENKKDAPFKYDKEAVTNMEGAAQTPWFDFKVEPDPDQVFDVLKLLAQMVKKAEGKNVSDVGLLQSVSELVKARQAEIDAKLAQKELETQGA